MDEVSVSHPKKLKFPSTYYEKKTFLRDIVLCTYKTLKLIILKQIEQTINSYERFMGNYAARLTHNSSSFSYFKIKMKFYN